MFDALKCLTKINEKAQSQNITFDILQYKLF